eukprot:scaffold4163_cov425-Prasinococcus_capsulatus_cf.AAC.15
MRNPAWRHASGRAACIAAGPRHAGCSAPRAAPQACVRPSPGPLRVGARSAHVYNRAHPGFSAAHK